MTYNEEDMLMLSGIQHYVFCPRQWALIHIEQIWEDNILTVEGEILHKNVDNPDYRAKNNGSILLRRVNLVSQRLGLYGFSDAIELTPTDNESNGIKYKRQKGRYVPIPIEYKRGKPKGDLCDVIQVVSQTMCLEEMYGLTLSTAMIYYWETNRRQEISVTDTLKDEALRISKEMHNIYESNILPDAQYNSKCKNCSLKNQCMPKLDNNINVKQYLKKNLYA